MSAAVATALWAATEAAAATGGSGPGGWFATGVSIDSRTIRRGDLFVALEGPNFDGHDFVGDAFARGAVAAVVSRIPGDLAVDAALLRVADTMAALEALGRASRARVAGRVIGVTGSVGKTGTKELLRLGLSAQGAVSASKGNLNNQWGLPLSLARMPAETDYGVFEMGMNHPGEIARLSTIARPHVGLITAVEPAHTEFFPSVEAIADAKAEIFTGMNGGSTAVLNRDNEHFRRLLAAAERAGVSTVVSFGTTPGADVHATVIDLADDGSTVEADVRGKTVRYRLMVPGRHWVINSLGALAAIDAAGADVIVAAEAFAGMVPLKGRGARLEIPFGDGSFLLIDESYNASPASMRAAIEVLGRARPAGGGRRIAVLGDMLELGDGSADMHAALAEPLRAAGIDLVFTCGAEMAALRRALPEAMRGGHAANPEELVPAVSGTVRAGDVVMVKGSLGSRVGVIVAEIAAFASDDGPAPRVVNGG